MYYTTAKHTDNQGRVDGWINDSCHKLDYRLVYTGAVEMLPFFSPPFSFRLFALGFHPLVLDAEY